ncbi:Imm26 family immunity protein [Roseimicrobium sp. ORNL1]|uniref:Imm26 family immunity protein n=1 Tax=Roseimicrobium sp. ORNL1 TaxID=2711231 RepID=UPI0013E19715|nr:Imm26 family immunity protein [Roseimicrobium sp. ORNL1]QIF04269.1 hypothetical protein G5S37_23010 [Roseimicrobium sp. ORNL1]
MKRIKAVGVSAVLESTVVFKIWVMNKATRSGRWPVIGHIPLSDELLKPVAFAKQDVISKAFCIHVGGKEVPASIEECRNLECAAVWSAEHVEDRLQDHFEGQPNKRVESMRIG